MASTLRPLSVHSIDKLYDLPASPPASPRRFPRNRSQTPLPSELEQFAENCRAWYYCQDDNAGRLMTQTLATLPASQRAPFSRLQASIRSAYHRSVNERRHAEFQAHLSATTPGASLLPHARSHPTGIEAQKERYERVDRFIRTWCNAAMPGTKPFFESLWAIFRLQVIPQNLGGAGTNRIDWEFDDAVFKESAGKDFMLEAIDILKGVLAFEDTASKPSSSRKRSAPAHARAQSQPLTSNAKFQLKNRPRAPSDPFLDVAAEGVPPPSPSFDLDEEDEEEYLRVWTSPDLSNPELLKLLKLFPDFVTRRPLPRFPVAAPIMDIEEGDEESTEVEARSIRFGTGSMWVSTKERAEGWNGGWWERFVMWWKRLFC